MHSYNFFPLTDEKLRRHLFYLASGVGDECIPDGWFCPLGAGCRPDDLDVSEHDITPTMDVQGNASADTATRSSAIESLNLQRTFQNMFDKRQAGANCSTGINVEDNRLANVNITAVLDGIQATADKLKDMVQLDPVEMVGPVETYIRQFNGLKTNAAVVSALQTFGKYTGAAESMSQRKRRRLSLLDKDRLKCRRGTMIKVQPTAVSRRKTPLGGKRCLQTGRKCQQNCWNQKARNQESSHFHLQRRRRKASHSLASCVKNNESIGKSHSSKW